MRNLLRGIRLPNSKNMAIIQGVVIGFHGNRMTNGTVPGEFNVTFFEQLSAEICFARSLKGEDSDETDKV